MTHKHTPGPWSTKEGHDRESGLKLTRVLFGASIVAECYGINSAANAQLIAAAPDLLKALDLLIGAAEQHAMSNDPDIKKELETARAAFKQATQGA